MAYTNRHIRIRFDGTQVNPHADRKKDEHGNIDKSEYDEAGNLIPVHYPQLGDDIEVTLFNPMLMPQSFLVPRKKIKLDANGNPEDPHEAFDATLPIAASLIAAWTMYDAFDLSDNPQSLPLPSSLKVDGSEDDRDAAVVALMKKVPGPVTEAISDLIAAARNPR